MKDLTNTIKNALVDVATKQIMAALFTGSPWFTFLKKPTEFLIKKFLDYILTQSIIGTNLVFIPLLISRDSEKLERARQSAIKLLADAKRKESKLTPEQIKEVDDEIIKEFDNLFRLGHAPL